MSEIPYIEETFLYLVIACRTLGLSEHSLSNNKFYIMFTFCLMLLFILFLFLLLSFFPEEELLLFLKEDAPKEVSQDMLSVIKTTVKLRASIFQVQ